MYWMDWISERLAVKRLRRKLPRHVAYSDKAAIRADFCRTAAQAAMASEEGESTIYALADELRVHLSEPNRQIKRDRFHRL